MERLFDIGAIRKTLLDFITGRGGALMYLSTLGLMLGGYSVVRILIEGHGPLSNTSSAVPWGIQITTYVFLVLISTGCTFTNFFGYTFYGKDYKPLSANIIFLGIVTAIGGMGSLALEMGRVERIYRFIISPNPVSPMWWMSVFYTIYVLLIVAEYITIRRGNHSNRMMWAAFIVAIMTHSTLGSLFGIIESRVYFFSALLPIYFLFVAFLTGGALSSVIASRSNVSIRPFRNFLRIGLGLVLLASFWRLIMGVISKVEGSEVFELTFRTTVVDHIIIALVLPFLLLTLFKGRVGLFVSSLLIIGSQFTSRHDLIMGGFKVPVFRVYDIPEVVTYTPTMIETFIVIAAFSFVIFLYSFANKSGLLDVPKTMAADSSGEAGEEVSNG